MSIAMPTMISMDILALRMAPLFQNDNGAISGYPWYPLICFKISIVLFQDILDGFKIGASGQSCSHLRKSCRQPKIFLDNWSFLIRFLWSKYSFVHWSNYCLISVESISAGNWCNNFFVFLWILCILSNFTHTHMCELYSKTHILVWPVSIVYFNI